ncbi:glutathionylspermidine synthase family protein [Salinithrix halophila]|uniref:Glutathionylspermidine synthase family protein n=1 Tax=Salinithrix halophila TaxID=1485204 RepID=A0ABV8JJN3_9BACL
MTRFEDRPYEERRQLIYGPVRKEGIFTWDWCYGREYALASSLPLSPYLHRQMAEATEALGRIFSRVIGVVRRGDASLMEELGIPKAAWGAVRLEANPSVPTVVGRFDFALTPDGLKMLEFNSDTPTGVVEAFYVNGQVCEAYGQRDPNEGKAVDIQEAFQRYLQPWRENGESVGEVVFSALGWHEEDAGTTRYLMEQSGLDARFVPLESLRVEGERLIAPYEGGMRPVDVLYRLHALEVLAEETDRDGYPTGARVLDLVAQGKLHLINPPSAFLAQTKALQALIWSLYEEEIFFTREERETIGRYMLPTYLENRFLGRSPHVVKPIFGREGGAVLLCDADGIIRCRDGEKAYWDQPMIYQERVEMEEVEAETLTGSFRGRRLWGSFLIGGRPSAILARLDGPITGNLAYYLPAFLDE